MGEIKDWKTIVALSEEFDDRLFVQLNALGHLGQNIGFQIAQSGDNKFVPYEDTNGHLVTLLSWWPLIVLKGKPQRVRQVWFDLQDLNLIRGIFTETMIAGGSEQQLAATRAADLDAVKFVAVAAFGPAEILNRITKRLSLWRNPGKIEAGSTTQLRPACNREQL